MSADDPFDDNLDDVDVPDYRGAGDQQSQDQGETCPVCGQQFPQGIPQDHRVPDCEYCGQKLCAATEAEHEQEHKWEEPNPPADQPARNEAPGDEQELEQARARSRNRRARNTRGGQQDIQTDARYRDTSGMDFDTGRALKTTAKILPVLIGIMFLFFYVKQALPIVMLLGGAASVYVSKGRLIDEDRTPVLHTFATLLFGLLWALTSANAVLSFLAGNFMSLDFVVNLLTAAMTTIYMTAGEGYREVGQAIGTLETVLLSGFEDPTTMGGSVPVAFLYALLGLFVPLIMFLVGLFTAMRVSVYDAVALGAFFFSLLIPVTFYHYIRFWKMKKSELESGARATRRTGREAARKGREQVSKRREQAGRLRDRVQERMASEEEEEDDQEQGGGSI